MTTDNGPLAAAKAQLHKLEQELSGRLEEADLSDSRPKMNSAVGRLTFMDEYQQHQMAEHGRRNAESQLARVRAALVRVEDGTYGKCARCGIDIPPERLEYMPETPFCVQCQG
jgi:RNA polymerase-binding transcription factor DksA